MTVINPNSVAGINSITVASGQALSVHKADGTLIQTIVSASGISTFSSISVGSATTTNNADKSINIGLGASISSHANNTLSLGTGGDERFRIDANGDINLGNNPTNQFGYKLNIQDSAIIYAQTASSGGLEAKWHLDNSAELMEFGTVSTDDLALVTTNIPRVRIDSGGDVGIGTDTMNAPLTVVNNDNAGYIASFRQKHASNSAQIIIDSPSDSNVRPASIDLAQAGTVKWSLGQAYASSSSQAFHIATSALQANENGSKLTITTAGAVGISSLIPTSGFLLDVGGDVTIGEPKGTGNSFLDQKEDGDLHIINSGRTANGASGSQGTAGVGINRFNTRAGGTSLFRDFCVYNGKDTKVLVVDGSASAVGIGTDAPDGALTIAHSGTSTDMLMFNRPGSVGTFARMGHNTSGGTNMLDVRSEGNTRFLTGGNNERLRIDSNGKFCFGTFNSNFASNDSVANFVNAASAGTENPLLTLWNPTTAQDARAGIDFLTNAQYGTDRDGAFIRASNNGVDAKANLIFGTIKDETYAELVRIDTDGFLTFEGDDDTGIKNTSTNTLQVHTNDTLCTEFSANQRVRMPQVYSTAGSSMRDVQIESDGTLAALTSITESKINIADVTDVSWLYNLKPKTFNFRKKTVDATTGVNTYLNEAEDEKAYGLLAEDVETINKDFCFYDKDSEGNDVLKGVYYKTMVVPLLKAVQDLKAENTALTTRVAALEGG